MMSGTAALRADPVAHLLAHGFQWMRFPRALEDEFARDTAPERLRQFKVSSIISLLVYNGFLLVDYLMAADVFNIAVQLRLMLFTPICVAVIAWVLTHRDHPLVRSPWLVDGCVLLGGLFAAGTLAFVLSLTQSPFRDFYHVGFGVVVMYGNIVQRLRFWSAVAYSVSLSVLQWICMSMLSNFNPRLVWPTSIMMLGVVSFSLCANYLMERDERRRYLRTRRERELVSNLSDVNLKLQQMSRVDALTGLVNRRHCHEYLQQVWQRAQHDASELCVVMVDVDHFKAYNDLWGHPAGDECLRQVASQLQSSVRRPGDLVARFGGEEFIAVLPQTSLDVGLHAAERIRQGIEALRLPHRQSPTAPVVTVSVGVACINAAAPRASPDALISEADRALYEAKRSGRNRTVSLVGTPTAG